MNQNRYGNLLLPLFQNGDVNAEHNWSSWNMESVTSTLRENLGLSVDSLMSQKWFVNVPYLDYGRADPFPHNCSEENFFISLQSGPSQGCGGITDDTEKPSLNSESEDMQPYKLPFLFFPHSQVYLAPQHFRQWVSPPSPHAQLSTAPCGLA